MSDFQSIGTQLKAAREDKDLTLEDVEKQTRIRLRFLQAIEYGQFFVIDNPTQLKGFLRKYAATVGLEDGEILKAYEAALQGERRRSKRPARRQAPATSATSPPPAQQPTRVQVQRQAIDTSRYANKLPETYQTDSRSLVSTVLIVGVLLGLVGAIVGGLAIIIGDVANGDNPDTSAGLIQSVNIGGTPSIQPSISPTTFIAPTLIGTPVISPGEPLNIQVTAITRVWLRVEVDGVLAFEGIFRPGDGVNYQPATTITIQTTNPAGLDVRVNGQVFVLGVGRQSVTRTINVQEGILPPEGQAIPLSAPSTALETEMAAEDQTTLSPSLTPTAPILLPTSTSADEPATPTAVPRLGGSTSTPSLTPSPVPPSATPTFTASPFLPERFTSTPTPDKGTQ